MPGFPEMLAANVISMAGSAAAPVALAFAVLGAGHGTGSLAVVLALNTLPSVGALLYGGVLADRTSRAHLLLGGRVAAGTLQLAVALLVLGHRSSTASLGALGFLSGIVTTLTRPAARGIVRDVVAPQQLQDALALNRLLTNLARIGAPALSGALVVATSPGWVLLFDAATFFVSAGLLARVRIDAPIVAAGNSHWHDLRQGWAAARERTWFLSATAFGAVIVVLWRTGYELLGPVIARAVYSGPAAWGLVQGALAGGMVVGGFISLRWKPYRIGALAAGSGAALGPVLVSLGLSCPLPLVMCAAFFAGVGQDVAIVAWSTVLGQHVEDRLQGRLQAINSIGEVSGVPLGYLLAAALGERLSPAALAAIAGAGIVAAGLGNLGVPSVWRINRTHPIVVRPRSVGSRRSGPRP